MNSTSSIRAYQRKLCIRRDIDAAVESIAHAAREKLSMFFIRRSAKPRCFKNIMSVPCRYGAQARSWVDGALFDEQIKDFEFEDVNRKVTLIVDNFPAHPHVEGLKVINLIFLPPNSTSRT